MSILSLQQVNIGSKVLRLLSFIVHQRWDYSIALSFWCILKIKGVVDNG
jgi:hypothetical protein